MKRTDLEEVLRGKGNYVDDLPYAGYYAYFVRSNYAHARIRKIDAEEAKNRGALVLTGEDLKLGIQTANKESEGSATILPLAYKKVRYVGEPIAIVIAEDPYKAADLAELVNVDYEPLPPVTSIDEAIKDQSILFEEVGTNVVYKNTFEYGKLPTSDKSIELDLYWNRSAGIPIETFGVVVYPGDPVIIYSNVQGAYAQAQGISKYLGKVKVVPTRHGGSFGSKFSLTNYIIALGLAAKKFNVPVKWIETRTEHLEASNSSGPERKFHINAYFRSDGTITALDFNVLEDIGATIFNGQALKALAILAGPYKIKNLRYNVKMLSTNKNPAGAFRGAGTPPHTWALERTMDAVADELKIDKSQIRLKNFIDEFPYEAPYAYYDSGNPKKLMELALSRNEIFELRKKGYGVGIAASTDPSSPSGQEGVRIRIKNGKVILGIGYGPEGQGNEHTAKLLASQLLHVPIEKIEVEILDNLESPVSFGPGGSRMALFMAGAIKGAAEELARKFREYGEFKDGYFVKANQKTSILDLEGEVSYVYSVQGKARFNAYPFAVDIAVVKMDESGLIKPVKLIVYIDPGTPLDEDLVKEQVIGGSATGVSLALYEAYRYSKDGQLQTSSLADYGLPSAMEMPEFEVNIVPEYSPLSPMGAKGIGEIPVGVAAAAVTSAVEDLLKTRINKVPIQLFLQ